MGIFLIFFGFNEYGSSPAFIVTVLRIPFPASFIFLWEAWLTFFQWVFLRISVFVVQKTSM